MNGQYNASKPCPLPKHNAYLYKTCQTCLNSSNTWVDLGSIGVCSGSKSFYGYALYYGASTSNNFNPICGLNNKKLFSPIKNLTLLPNTKTQPRLILATISQAIAVIVFKMDVVIV